jgi:hypothetical protein
MVIIKSLSEMVSKESTPPGETKFSRGLEYYNRIVLGEQ